MSDKIDSLKSFSRLKGFLKNLDLTHYSTGTSTLLLKCESIIYKIGLNSSRYYSISLQYNYTNLTTVKSVQPTATNTVLIELIVYVLHILSKSIMGS